MYDRTENKCSQAPRTQNIFLYGLGSISRGSFSFPFSFIVLSLPLPFPVFFLFLLFFFAKFSLCIPGCPGTHCVADINLESSGIFLLQEDHRQESPHLAGGEVLRNNFVDTPFQILSSGYISEG